MQLVYGVAGLALVPVLVAVVPAHRNPKLSLDPAGSLFALIALAAVAYGLTQAPDSGWLTARTVAVLLLGLVAFAVFVAVELRASDPLLDVRLFRAPGLAAGSLLVLLVSLAAFGFFLLGPQYLQLAGGHDALGAALRLMPFAVGIAPASAIVPRLVGVLGARWVAAFAAGMMATAFLLLAITAEAAYWHFAIALIVFAFGFGAALTAGTSLILGGLPADRRTLASAVNDVTREVGGALGAAILSSVLLTHYHAVLASGITLPVPAADRAREGAGEALAVAGQLGASGRELARTAVTGFREGYQIAMVVGSVVLLATAVLVGWLAPQGEGHVANESAELRQGQVKTATTSPRQPATAASHGR